MNMPSAGSPALQTVSPKPNVSVRAGGQPLDLVARQRRRISTVARKSASGSAAADDAGLPHRLASGLR
jgi:hypothetical protein